MNKLALTTDQWNPDIYFFTDLSKTSSNRTSPVTSSSQILLRQTQNLHAMTSGLALRSSTGIVCGTVGTPSSH